MHTFRHTHTHTHIHSLWCFNPLTLPFLSPEHVQTHHLCPLVSPAAPICILIQISLSPSACDEITHTHKHTHTHTHTHTQTHTHTHIHTCTHSHIHGHQTQRYVHSHAISSGVYKSRSPFSAMGQ